MLFLNLPRRVFLYMLGMVKVRFVGVQLYAYRVAQLDPEVAGQGCPYFPAVAFYVEIQFPPAVIVNRTTGIIPVMAFGSIPVGRGMGRRAALFILMA